jgi:two-component system, OmpR family, alkaline phosphatase synthesis response regulator PhoP
MQNVLVIAASEKGGHAGPIIGALKDAGYAVARASLDHGISAVEELCQAFDGRPPDVLLADLSTAVDCLPLRHTSRLLQRAWGEGLPMPACIALLEPRHLILPDWLPSTDDFVLPPYAPSETLARISQLLFRKRQVQSGDLLHLPDITLDLAGARAIDLSGHVLPLTPREYDLLRFLATHRGKFFARDRLLDMVWGVDFDGGERTVDIHIRRLRAKLPEQTAILLETRRSIGYGLLPPSNT